MDTHAGQQIHIVYRQSSLFCCLRSYYQCPLSVLQCTYDREYAIVCALYIMRTGSIAESKENNKSEPFTNW